ncbi:hypothetical protein TNCV_4917241 [Trichonephila clavipes]|nr:hypothetical protein TNCV_4917241 [Trichonephila clavipes]
MLFSPGKTCSPTTSIEQWHSRRSTNPETHTVKTEFYRLSVKAPLNATHPQENGTVEKTGTNEENDACGMIQNNYNSKKKGIDADAAFAQGTGIKF